MRWAILIMSLTIVIADAVTPLVEGAQELMTQPRLINRAAAEGALRSVRGALVERAGSEHNPFGARGGFWNRMLAGTVAGADDAAGFVRMPREVALRVHGGTVTPQQKKFLAIPARAEAYGKSPREFNDLRFVPTKGKGGGGILVQNEQTRISYGRKRKDGSAARKTEQAGGGVFFFLVTSATIRGDRSILPSDEELMGAAVRGIRTLVSARLARARKGGQA